MFKSLLHPLIKPVRCAANSLLSWPSACAVCRSWPSQQVCDDCKARFLPALARCRACALALPPDLSMGLRDMPENCMACERHHPPVDRTLVAAHYAYPWSELIARYKFGQRPGWAGVFADVLLASSGVQQAFDALDADDFIVPLPLSPERLESRGFNQAWELACALKTQSASQARADAGLLLRVRHTRPQSDLQREARLVNVKGAFQVDPLRVPALGGRRVVLVDDVMTSGATLFTAAQALRAAGAAHITAVAFARTPAP